MVLRSAFRLSLLMLCVALVAGCVARAAVRTAGAVAETSVGVAGAVVCTGVDIVVRDPRCAR
ncbi:MAG: hypothetical protein AAGL89_13845 [Pseudomonadota bacterium]